jgi:hypothetical protein
MDKGLPPLKANILSLADVDDDDIFAMLPPDFALVGTMGTEPQTIDEALCGPNAKECQLKKLRT